jgi:moderate conductance mechanosensitive channel
MMGLDRFLDSGVIVRFIIKTKPGFQWQVSREFNKRMKQKFDELDIQLPFPHRMVYFGENKDHTPASPAYVKVNLQQDDVADTHS